jgi:membrane protein DedA with SNARE-associated domain
VAEANLPHPPASAPAPAVDTPIGIALDPDARAAIRRCLTLLGVLGSGSMLGVAFSLYLVNHYPLLLVALSPLGRHLVLVAPTVDPLAFIAVATTRRLLFYLGCFFLGRALGPSGIVWLERRAARMARFVRWLERLFRRVGYPALVFLPGPTMSTIAGSSGMKPRTFAALATLGLVLRMIVVIGFAEWLRTPIEALLALIDAYWMQGTVVLVAGIALYQWRRGSRAQDASSGLL